MAKDMSKVYADMLTKELVDLRARHMEAYKSYLAIPSRKAKQEAARREGLVRQINDELASRIADFGLKV